MIATKGGIIRPGPTQWVPHGHPDHLHRAVDQSLRRLRVDTIALYQLHAPDPQVPFEDQVGALAEMKQQGKIQHVGLSNVDVEQLAKARAIVDIASVQNRFNLLDRTHEPVLRECERLGIAFIPWYPLATGDLASPGSSVSGIAKARDATPGQVALAWLLQRSPVMLPIPGTSSEEHLRENLGAARLELSAGEMARLDAIG